MGKDTTTYRHKSTNLIMDCILMPPHQTSTHPRVTNEGNESVQDADKVSSMLLHDAGRTETPRENSRATSENNSRDNRNSLMPSEYTPSSRENSPTPSDNSIARTMTCLARIARHRARTACLIVTPRV